MKSAAIALVWWVEIVSDVISTGSTSDFVPVISGEFDTLQI